MIHIDGVKDNMIANNVDPFEPTHPGEVIRDELEDRGMSQRQLAKKMGMSYSVLNDIINGKRDISVEYAMMLEAALGIDADLWINMQTQYSKQMAKRDKGFLSKLENIRRVAGALVKPCGFITRR